MTGLTERDLCAPAAKGDTCPRVFDKVRARRPLDKVRARRPLDKVRARRPLDKVRARRPLNKVRDGIRTARRRLGNADRRPLSLAA
ncbi:hypothetical protein ACFWIJ_09005 [Streptomyces sp. NPDC127079]|uniref:hypothetical protein n=1 Tax=Streptomyces sp. NPDC127079 TaxID=3347132 RepID=UPI0036589D11